MSNFFLQLALILTLSSAFGYIVHRLKLPLVVAYLLAGVVISFVNFQNLTSVNIFTFLPNLGIAFVLFLIGMELDLREIRALGLPIMVASLLQITISILAGFAIAGYLGFSQTISLYMGLSLAFSSTIVVIKMLLEKKDLTSLYGKLSVGILLIEDLVAITVLMFISVGGSVFHLGLQQSLPLLAIILKAAGLFILTFILSRYVLEKVFDAVAKSVELLFLTAITWCFLFTSLAVVAGFSVVIGAFLAGVALASSPYHLQIQGKIKPLRDFFVALFFVYLGSQTKIVDIANNLNVVFIFTFYAILIKPVIFLLILGSFGFRKHTIFKTAINLSQISEFSLVILLVGVSQGLIPQVALSIMAGVAVLSVLISSSVISYGRFIYKFVSPVLSFFERSSKLHFLETEALEQLDDHVVLIGAQHVGGPIVKFLKRENIPFLVIDFNPHIVEQLRDEKVKVIYGDVGDPDILENLSLEKAKLIISTAADVSDNEFLLDECRRKRVRAKIIVRAPDEIYAKALKDLGADYVIVPEKVSGDFLVNQLKIHWPNLNFAGLE